MNELIFMTHFMEYFTNNLNGLVLNHASNVSFN
jgi:hypothetical protein